MIALPVAVEPVNMILSIVGVRGQGLADLAAAGDDREEALGEHLVHDLDEGEDGQRGVLGGLDHDGVAHAQGGGDLPDGDHHRPVPRADRADDADGPVVQLGVGLAVVDHGLRLERGGGGGAQPGGAGADLEAGVRAVERLALFAGEQRGEFLGGAFDGVGGLEQGRGPGVVAQRGPGRLRGLCGGDGLLQVLDGVDRSLPDRFAGGRVQDGPGRTGGRGDRGEKGVVGFHGCTPHRVGQRTRPVRPASVASSVLRRGAAGLVYPRRAVVRERTERPRHCLRLRSGARPKKKHVVDFLEGCSDG